jgi:hypothetical protein
VLVVVVIGLAADETVLPNSEDTVSSALQANTDPAALYDTDPWFRMQPFRRSDGAPAGDAAA